MAKAALHFTPIELNITLLFRGVDFCTNYPSRYNVYQFWKKVQATTLYVGVALSEGEKEGCGSGWLGESPALAIDRSQHDIVRVNAYISADGTKEVS